MAKKKTEEVEVKDAAQEVVDRRAKLGQILDEIKKAHPGVVAGFGDEEEVLSHIRYDKIPTGIATLDPLLGGGVPKGKTTVMFGPKSSGKTTICYQIIANFQNLYPDQYCVIVDADNTADKVWMEHIGIDLSRVIIIPGTNDLEALGDYVVNICNKMGKDVGLILVDAVGSLIPRAEYAGKKATRGEEGNSSLADDNMAVAARRMGQFLRKTNVIFAKNTVAGLFIAHVYTDLSPTGGGRLIMKGGTALQHFAHVALKFAQRNDEVFKENVLCPDGQVRELRTGHFVEITIDKTRQSSSQYKQVYVPFRIGMGFDTMMALFNSAVGYGIIDKAGAWYSYKGEKVGQGGAKAIEELTKNDKLRLEIQTKLVEILARDGVFGAEASQKPPEKVEAIDQATGEIL